MDTGCSLLSTVQVAPKQNMSVKRFTIRFENGNLLHLNSPSFRSSSSTSNSESDSQNSCDVVPQTVTNVASPVPEDEPASISNLHLTDAVFEQLENCLRDHGKRSSSGFASQSFDQLVATCAPPHTGNFSHVSHRHSTQDAPVKLNRAAVGQLMSGCHSRSHSLLSVSEDNHNCSDRFMALVHVLLRQDDKYSSLAKSETTVSSSGKPRSSQFTPATHLLSKFTKQRVIINDEERTIGELSTKSVWKLIKDECHAAHYENEADSDREFDTSSQNSDQYSSNCLTEASQPSLQQTDEPQTVQESGSAMDCAIPEDATFTSHSINEAPAEERSVEAGTGCIDLSTGTLDSAAGLQTSKNARPLQHTVLVKTGEAADISGKMVASYVELSDLQEIINCIPIRPTKFAHCKFDDSGRVTCYFKRNRVKEIMDQLFDDGQPITAFIVTELLRKHENLLIDTTAVSSLMHQAGYRSGEERYRWVRCESRDRDLSRVRCSEAMQLQSKFEEIVYNQASIHGSVSLECLMRALFVEGVRISEGCARKFMGDLPYMRFNPSVNAWVRHDEEFSTLSSMYIKIKQITDELVRRGNRDVTTSLIVAKLLATGCRLKRSRICIHVDRVVRSLGYLEFNDAKKTWHLKLSNPANKDSNSNSSAPVVVVSGNASDGSATTNDVKQLPNPSIEQNGRKRARESIEPQATYPRTATVDHRPTPASLPLQSPAVENANKIGLSQIRGILDYIYANGGDISVTEVIDICREKHGQTLDPLELIRLMVEAGYDKIGPGDTDWALCLSTKREKRNEVSTLLSEITGTRSDNPFSVSTTSSSCNRSQTASLSPRTSIASISALDDMTGDEADLNRTVSSCMSHEQIRSMISDVVHQFHLAGRHISTRSVQSELLSRGVFVPLLRVKHQMEALPGFYSHRSSWKPVDKAYFERIDRTKRRLAELSRTQTLTTTLIRNQIALGNIQGSVKFVEQLMQKCGYVFCANTSSWVSLAHANNDPERFHHDHLPFTGANLPLQLSTSHV